VSTTNHLSLNHFKVTAIPVPTLSFGFTHNNFQIISKGFPLSQFPPKFVAMFFSVCTENELSTFPSGFKAKY
jgi:hypothetical protein